MKTKKTNSKKTAPKKVAVKKEAPKKATAKKEAPKKVTTKKEAPKKIVKSATGNKELDLMLAKIKEATKKGDKKVIVYTTTTESHKANTGSNGFGVDDLKPKLYEAYKHLLCKFDVKAKLVNASDMAVEWTVNIKK